MIKFNAMERASVPVSAGTDSFKVSITDIFKSNNHLSLAGNYWDIIPPLRLLTCIATAATHPQTNDEIRSYLNDIPHFCEKVQQYMDGWKDKFNIYDSESPFLQVLFLKKDYPNWKSKTKGYKRISTARLMLEEGKTTTKLRTEEGETLNDSVIFLALLKAQVLGGTLKYGNQNCPGPDLVPNGQVKKQNSTYPPSLSTNGFSGTLNYHVIDPTDLVKTVILNMIPEEDIKTIFPKGFGKPVWEFDVWKDYSEFLGIAENLTQTFLGRLIPLTKFIWVDPERPDEIIYSHAEGVEYQEVLKNMKKLDTNTIRYDQTYFMPIEDPKKTATLKHTKKNQSLWKDLANLDIDRNTPWVLNKFRKKCCNKILIFSSALRIRGGMGLVFEQEFYSSHLIWNGEVLRVFLTDSNSKLGLGLMVEKAEKTYEKLLRALFFLHKELNMVKSDGNVSSIAKGETEKSTAYFWSELNKFFQSFLDRIDQENIHQEWETLVKKSARDSLFLLRDNYPRRNKAIIKALESLKRRKI